VKNIAEHAHENSQFNIKSRNGDSLLPAAAGICNQGLLIQRGLEEYSVMSLHYHIISNVLKNFRRERIFVKKSD